jgi:uncharacterized membrane protein YbhN (UPF0104 family)
MLTSFDEFREAVSVFGDRLTDIRPVPLLVAITLHAISLGIRAWVWRGILAVAFPDRVVRYWPVLEAYLAGIGVNALVPARGGDVVRVYAVRRVLPGASITVIVATLIAETAFGLVVVVALAVLTAAAGWVPPLVRLPNEPVFEFSFYAQHTLVVTGVALAVCVLATLSIRRGGAAARSVAQRVWQGLRILRSPAAFVRIVAVPQLVDWVLRIAVAYALLDAFGIHASVRAAVVVVVVDSVSTALPFTPGGVGAQQGLLVFCLAGAATPGQVLAFSVGSQGAITASNLILGAIAVFLLFGHLRFRRVSREAHDSHTADR